MNDNERLNPISCAFLNRKVELKISPCIDSFEYLLNFECVGESYTAFTVTRNDLKQFADAIADTIA